MPRLYSIKDDFLEGSMIPSHFFPSAKYANHSISGGLHSWRFDIDADFPTQCYIHQDNLDTNDTDFWIALRKDAERIYSGDCFYRYQKMNYRRWWNRDATADYMKRYTEQRHGYWIFYFEEGSDQALFILKHAEKLSSKPYRFHPDYGISCNDSRYDVDPDEAVPDAYRI